MLILTRRANESLVIGDEISVTVLGIRGGQVRLGVEAPKDVAVHREEVVAQDPDSAEVSAQVQADTAPEQTARAPDAGPENG